MFVQISNNVWVAAAHVTSIQIVGTEAGYVVNVYVSNNNKPFQIQPRSNARDHVDELVRELQASIKEALHPVNM